MMREQELLDMAETYREMAEQALDPQLRLDFLERAARYETVVWAVKRGKTAPKPD
jgi:hypothetical protein